MKALNLLAGFKTEFETSLAEFVRVEKNKASDIDRDYAKFFEILEEFTLRGGKRLRPAFVYFAYLACGGKNKSEAMKASRSMELLQTFLLMHDDITDRSDLRRGKPTTHRMFEEVFAKLGLSGDREHFGTSMAMICGDIAHMMAYDALMNTDFPLGTIEKARKVFDRIMFDTAYGWYREMLNTMKVEVEEADVLRAMEYVTARYTIAGPVVLGATLADADEGTKEFLRLFGLKLGVAFQIQDDILGMFGNEEEVGKPVNSDLVEGKKTLLYVKTIERLRRVGDEKRLVKFLKIYGKSDKLVDFEWVRGLMMELGVLDETKEKAKSLAREAIEILASGKFEGEGGEFLAGIATYIVERKV